MNEKDIIEEIDIVENEKKVLKEKEKQPIRDTLYGRIDVSIQTMDKFIIGVIILLVISLLFAIITK